MYITKDKNKIKYNHALTYMLLMPRIGSWNMTLIRSKPSTRRSTLLLYWSHAVKIMFDWHTVQ